MRQAKPSTDTLRPRDEDVSARLLRNSEQIMKNWEECLRKELPNAINQSSTALRNSLPEYLKEVADCLRSHAEPESCGDEGVAKEHGKQRADLGRFTLDQVLYEYRVLRRVIMETLLSTGKVTHDESGRLVDFIQFGMAQAAHEFSELTHGREKADLARLEMERDLREQFVSMLTHDLRNPLSAIKTSAQLLLRRPNQTEIVETMASRIVTNVDRTDRMIQDLLDSNRIRAGQKLSVQLELVEIGSIIQDAVTELATIYGNRFKLDVQKDLKGYWSPTDLRRSLENLITNALKYGDSNQLITVSAKEYGDLIQICVHNWGNPISPEDQKEIFQRFRRLDSAQASSQKGWGLGLTLVRGVAEAHRGRVWVESNPEDGTVFILEISKDPRPREA